MPVPAPMSAVAPFAPDCAFEAPTTAAPVFHEVHMRKASVEIIPGVATEIQGYDGLYPGPTLRSHAGIPDVVRMVNDLDVETVVHQHGGHNPAASDGSPFPDEIIFPGTSRDYCYPNQPAGGRAAPRLAAPSPRRHRGSIYFLTVKLEEPRTIDQSGRRPEPQVARVRGSE